MRQDYQLFQQAGLDVVAVGLGSPTRTREFRQEFQVPFPILSDPRRVAYRAYGLLRLNLRREATITSAVRMVRASIRHGGRREPEQDMLQLGGVFVVGTNGIIQYAFRSSRAYEFPSSHELLRAATNDQSPMARNRPGSDA